jgi:hypothetical protein
MVARPGWLTRSVLAWALNDVASSTFAALVPVFLGSFFAAVIAVDNPGAQGHWGAIALLAPLLARWHRSTARGPTRAPACSHCSEWWPRYRWSICRQLRLQASSRRAHPYGGRDG